jgi:hypothetical protein
MIKKATTWMGSFLLVSSFFLSSFDIALAQKSQKKAPKSGNSRKEVVKPIRGSRILFQEDAVDFGEIPYDRRVTHIFKFKNIGTAPLSVAKHATSKVIEGC